MYVPKIDIDTKKAEVGFVNRNLAAKKAFRNTLNILAFQTRKSGIKKINENFIIRNKFTQSQIRVEQVKDKRLSIKNMQSEVGATDKADYMERQEKGGVRKSKRGPNLAIPQKTSRGGSLRKLVQKPMYLNTIKNRTVRGPFSKNMQSKKARLVARAYMAKKLDLFIHHNKNIYKVTSFNKAKKAVKFRMKHIYNVSKQRTITKGDPWLKPSTVKPINDAQQIYNGQIKKMLNEKMI